MAKQVAEPEVVESAESPAYAGLTPQQKGGFMLWLKSNISEILSLMKDIRAKQKQIPLEVQTLLDEIAVLEKAIDKKTKSIYAKAKEIHLRKSIEVDLTSLTYVKKLLSLGAEEHFDELKTRFVERLKEDNVPEADIMRIVLLLDKAHTEALAVKKLQESYTLYAKLE